MLKTIRGVLRSTWVGAAVLILAGALIQPANATVILEGSDAIGLHSRFGDPNAVAYRDQTWTAIGGSDARPIAAIGSATLSSGTHSIVNFASVAAAGPLSDYVALYFISSGGGCCVEDDSLVTASGAEAAISAYLTAGGTVMIENYTGGVAWDFAVGAGGAGNAHVSGLGGGLGGSGCSDGETVTAAGTLNGFTQPSPIRCWSHQAYDQAGFFAALGFTTSYFNGGPDYPAGFSSLLANGKTVTGGGGGVSVPEPPTPVLFGLGLAGLAFSRCSRRKRAR
ncbi:MULTISPECIES: PEP-CTERM sorting domain-containing protein [Rhodanobacter]|uniref:PEP-CTERM sorting domain-containing protein n=1 Tax=Rhodanobacter TaxID=75309 RepID=UPI0009DC06A9|nr:MULTISPECIES: PEP-CTERM sorting domain-containing protein [Rhodanobacter]TAN14512.1 MAG: PEP-CTERM sorting domain-containing protein [Rhodanobacter sp.]UJJ55960.1 PEP-CTERM sorting domain-containing protein [Rhodanobacter thiooxydans]